MSLPKITIMKRFYISNKGHYRYYSPFIDIENRNTKKRPRSPTYDLDPSPSTYPHIAIKSEKQLCYFIFKKFGEGEFWVSGHVKGHKGTWTFWRGNISREGFVADRRDKNNTREINALQKELVEAVDEEEKQDIKDEIELEKEFNVDVKYGFQPYLQSSGRRGELVLWTDEEEIKDKIKEKAAKKLEEVNVW
jgi:hypothetical protein